MTALQELLAKVKAGIAVYRDFSCFEVPSQCMQYTERAISARMAYNGSLDAAKALHEAVLPEWMVAQIRQENFIGRWVVRLFYTEAMHGVDNCPARAWLIAIIEALIAQEKST